MPNSRVPNVILGAEGEVASDLTKKFAKYVVVDTETTGFPRKLLGPTHKDQARVLQFAFCLLDEEMNPLASACTLIKSQHEAGHNINPGAQAAHGISNERCLKEGIRFEEFISCLSKVLHDNADTLEYLVAHNITFDDEMLLIEASHAIKHPLLGETGIYIANVLGELVPRCTMEMSTELCKLPFANGKKKFGQKYKWPSLAEAYKFFFNEELKDAHDANADVIACARILKVITDKQQESQSISNN